MAAKKKIELGERELDILQVLWRLGGATVGEVHQELRGEGNDIAYTTVQTMLTRLEAKGFVACDATDRAHRYEPRLKERNVVGGAIRNLTGRFFRGSKEALAVRLVEQDLTDEQLERLRARIDELRGGTKR